MNMQRWILFTILFLALGLRLWGCGFGLPDSYHVDEERIVHHALAFGMGDLNPHYFNYPSLPMYLLFFEYGLFYALGRVFGLFGGVADFQKLFFANPTAFYLIGRATSALLGTASVLLVYLLGKKAYGRGAGLAAAFVLAITFLHVESSHYIATDIPMTFFIAASFIFIIGILETGKRKAYVWAGILGGLGAASKYNAATLIIPIFLAHLWSPSPKRGWRGILFHPYLWLSAGGMLLAFFAGSPYCFLDFPRFWRDFRFISEHMRVGVYSTGGGHHWIDYLVLFFRDRMYFAPSRWNTLGLLYFGGVAWVLLRRRRKEWLLLIYPVLYFLMIGSWGKCNPRYLIPVFPTLAVLAGGALQSMWSASSSRPRAKAAISAGIVFLSVVPLRNIVLNNRMFSRVDTRTEARRWIEGTIPAGTKIAMEWDNNATVQLQELDREIEEKIQGYQKGELSTIHHTPEQMAMVHRLRLGARPGKKYDIVRIGEVDGLTLIPSLYNIEEIRKSGVEYLVASSLMYNWFTGGRGKQSYPVHVAFYDELFKMKPAKVFQPVDQPGPVIKIYRLQER